MMNWAVFWTAAGVVVTCAGLGLTWFIHRTTARAADAGLAIETSDWVVERGLTYEELLRLLLSLDHAALPGLTDSSAGNAVTKSHVFEKSQETWGLVISDGTLPVGYWSCFSLSKKLISRLKQGEMFDSEIVEHEVHRINEPIEHNLYFEMIGVHPAFRHRERSIIRMIFQSLDGFAEGARAGTIRISGIYANGFTERGAALCRRFGMQPLAQSAQGGDVFHTSDIGSALGSLKQLSRKRKGL